MVSRRFWANDLAVCISSSLCLVAGTSSTISLMFTCGLIPIRSSCGVCCIPSCFQELWAYSAIRSMSAQLSCRAVDHGQRYCSIQAFILSVCPSVLGWKAVDKFCWMPSALQIVFENLDVNCGSQLDMILLGMPNQGVRCFRYL